MSMKMSKYCRYGDRNRQYIHWTFYSTDSKMNVFVFFFYFLEIYNLHILIETNKPLLRPTTGMKASIVFIVLFFFFVDVCIQFNCQTFFAINTFQYTLIASYCLLLVFFSVHRKFIRATLLKHKQ